MYTTIQINNQIITADKIIYLLKNYQMMPQLIREIIIDKAIEAIAYSDSERESAILSFYQENQIQSQAEIDNWLIKNEMNCEYLESLIIRKLKIEKFKHQQWSSQLKSYFMTRKLTLERADFSLIRVQEERIARELYYRLQEEEQSFAELAAEYSLDSPAENNGLVNRARLKDIDIRLAKILYGSQPGKLFPPIQLDETWVIVRLEQYFPAKLDEMMREYLLNELFDQWLQKQLQELELSLV